MPLRSNPEHETTALLKTQSEKLSSKTFNANLHLKNQAEKSVIYGSSTPPACFHANMYGVFVISQNLTDTGSAIFILIDLR
ncbi:hypothetical protein [Acetobacter malorum]|uniref:Uncharacterized protein n=1 Tax=Acetobacter malorum TaxID=178901 RepID=A0A1Y3G9T1_9PROT|nr:hypothetical protein [Acetobacter malorum]OUJ06499.1 hypothetical protein HK23_01585 [Acetobacter malorum]